MKTTTMLPLVAIMSGVLVGCGGDSSSSSSSASTPAVTTYNFQFIQMEVDQNPANLSDTCVDPTYFKEYDTDNVDYAKTATGDFEVESYNADGSFNKSLTDDLDQNDGTLSFTSEDVEDGGYISIIEELSSSYQSLSIQKELLGDYLINVSVSQGNAATCYSSNALSYLDTTKETYVGFTGYSGSDDLTASGYETYNEGEGQQLSGIASLKSGILVLSDSEQVLLSAYSDNEIKGYSLVSASDLSSATPKELEPLTDEVTVTWPSSPNYTLSDVEVSAYTSSTGFDWQSFTVSDNTGETSLFVTSDDFDYSVKASGEYNGWEVEANKPDSEAATSGFTIDLTDTVVSDGITPAVSCSSGICVVDNNGLVGLSDDEDSLFQRSYIELSSNGTNHTIYSVANVSDEVILPEFNLDSDHQVSAYDESSDTSDTLEVSYFITPEEISSEVVAFMANKYHDPESTEDYVDKVSLVIPPAQYPDRKLYGMNTEYEIIQK